MDTLTFLVVAVVCFGYGTVVGHAAGYEQGKQTRTKE